MVEFGAPVSTDRHREDALDCAIAIYRSSAELQRQIQSLGVDWKLDFGIGINSGEAIVGNIGTSRRTEYTALGDVVNTASRIEGLTKRFHTPIVVGENTYNDNLKALLDEGQTVNVRGKSTPVKVYTLKL
jgi:adenylate cyclase